MKRLPAALMVIAVVALAATGCQQGPADAGPELLAQQAAPPGQTISPPNEYRRRLTREAMRGLRYDSGLVEIDLEQAAKIVQTRDARQAQIENERGQAALHRNALNESIRAHTKAVLLDPQDPTLYEALGMVWLAKRKPKNAAAAFRTALELAPDSVSARFRLAVALEWIGRRQQAVKEFYEVLARDPEHAAAHGRLAVELYYANRRDEAAEHLRRAEELGYDVPPQLESLLAGNLPRTFSRSGPPVIGPQTRVDSTNTGPGNETSIASLDSDTSRVLATWNDYRQDMARLGVGLSNDGGQTWSDFLVRPPVANRSETEGDPMTAFDNRTGTLWVGAISFGGNGGVYTARLDPGESTFAPTVMAEVSGGADKGWMAAGPDPDNPSQTLVYITYNEGLLISADMGDTWTGPVSLGAGLGQLPRIGPNGELYICYWDTSGYGTRIRLYRSFDGGDTLQGPYLIATRMDVWGVDGSRFPGRFRVAPLAHLAVDPNDGTLYCVYFDTTNVVGGNSNVDLYFTKSTNQGTNWTTPVVINTDATPPGDQFFPWIEVDQAGRLHLVFFDTRAVVQDDDEYDSTPTAWVQAYYAYSDDTGDTWQEVVLTDTPFNVANDGFGGYFFGDYLGLAVGMRRAWPCYLTTETGTAHVYTRTVVNVVTGDVDADGDIDLGDHAAFAACLTGPGGGILPDCDSADLDADGDVDLEDFTEFIRLFGT